MASILRKMLNKYGMSDSEYLAYYNAKQNDKNVRIDEYQERNGRIKTVEIQKQEETRGSFSSSNPSSDFGAILFLIGILITGFVAFGVIGLLWFGIKQLF